MAIRHIETFRTATTTAGIAARYQATSGFALHPTGGRDGAPCAEFAAAAAGHVALDLSIVATLAAAMWVVLPSLPAADVTVLDFGGSAASGYLTHVKLVVRPDGVLEVRRGNASGAADTVLATSTGGPVATGTRVHLGLFATISDTTGTVKVTRGAALEPGLSDPAETQGRLTNLDTLNGSAGTSAARAYFGTRTSAGFAAPWTACALYLMTSGGNFNNDLVGDAEPVLVSVTGPGFYNQSAIGGTAPAATRWESVDDPPGAPDGDATTVVFGDATSGPKDTYAHAGLPAQYAGVARVIAVRLVLFAKTSTGLNVDSLARAGTTDLTGGAVGHTSNTSYTQVRTVVGHAWNAYPGQTTSAADVWTPARFAATEFGAGRLGTTNTLTVTQALLEVLVPYAAPTPTGRARRGYGLLFG